MCTCLLLLILAGLFEVAIDPVPSILADMVGQAQFVGTYWFVVLRPRNLCHPTYGVLGVQ